MGGTLPQGRRLRTGPPALTRAQTVRVIPLSIEEAGRLRAQAARCLRLSKEALAERVQSALRDMAAECLEKAQALERAVDQQQQQVGNVVPLPEPSHGVTQQQQQIQPDKDGKTE